MLFCRHLSYLTALITQNTLLRGTGRHPSHDYFYEVHIVLGRERKLLKILIYVFM